MGSRFYSVVIDSEEPPVLARWWAEVLDWQVVYEAADETVIAADEDAEPALVSCRCPSARA